MAGWQTSCPSCGAPHDPLLLLLLLLQEGRVWVLGEEEEGGGGGGVLLISREGQVPGLPFAGVVVGSPAALGSAVLRAAAEEPGCVKFYIDRCEAFEHSDLFELLQRHDYLVLHKLLLPPG